jgi:hypothetical protein
VVSWISVVGLVFWSLWFLWFSYRHLANTRNKLDRNTGFSGLFRSADQRDHTSKTD